MFFPEGERPYKTMHLAVVEIKVVMYVGTVKLTLSNAFEQ
jgi:hypothetical protein